MTLLLIYMGGTAEAVKIMFNVKQNFVPFKIRD